MSLVKGAFVLFYYVTFLNRVGFAFFLLSCCEFFFVVPLRVRGVVRFSQTARGLIEEIISLININIFNLIKFHNTIVSLELKKLNINLLATQCLIKSSQKHGATVS